MKRFEFQLQTALDWRMRRMESEQAKLDGMEGRRESLLIARQQLEESWRTSHEELLARRELTSADLTALESYHRAVDNQGTRLLNEWQRMEETIARQRLVLMQVTREYRLLEKLKTRRLAEWKRAADQQVEAEAGELYLAQWCRGDDDSL